MAIITRDMEPRKIPYQSTTQKRQKDTKGYKRWFPILGLSIAKSSFMTPLTVVNHKGATLH